MCKNILPPIDININTHPLYEYYTLTTHTQFDRFDPEEGRISERDFAKMILSYADINDQQKKKYMKRVKRAYEDGKVRERETQIYTVLPGFVCIYIDTSLNRTPFPTPSTTLACISITEMRTPH